MVVVGNDGLRLALRDRRPGANGVGGVGAKGQDLPGGVGGEGVAAGHILRLRLSFPIQYGRPKPEPIGSEFPYKGGERAIFHFDQGDERFIETIKPLVKVRVATKKTPKTDSPFILA